MGSIFSKPKAPKPFEPTESQRKLEREQLETRREQSSEVAKRAAAAKGKSGRRSLLTGSAKGVEKSNTLG